MSLLQRRGEDKMITKVEFNYLRKLKKFENMPEDQMEQELINLIGNENGSKILKKQIRNLEEDVEKKNKKIERLEQTMKRKDKTLFDLSIKKAANKMEARETKRGYHANVGQLKRILCLLEAEEKSINKSQIFKACGMINSQGKSALNFLANHNLINCERGNYSICL